MGERKTVQGRCWQTGLHLSPPQSSQHSLWVWLEAHKCEPQPGLPAGTGSLVLVWRDERGEEIMRTPPLPPGTKRIAIPPVAQHVDLLGDRHG